MATIVPAMKGKMGDINYYVISMKAGEVIKTLTIPLEMPGWEDLSIEERYQREIDYSRVRNHIAPYLANVSSRFFGALIVTVLDNDQALDFQSLNNDTFAGELRSAYISASENIGFLTLHGGQLIVPLDGQHRLKALEFAINGKDHEGKKIPDIKAPCTKLASEDLVLILVDPIKEKTKKIRRIFTRINLTARKPTAGENIVTNDDDVIAVIARRIASDEIDEKKKVRIGARLVKYKSNTLKLKDHYFTTLAIIYNINEAVIKAYYPPPDVAKLPDSETVEEYDEQCKKVWAFLLDNIKIFQDMLSDLGPDGDDLRSQIRQKNLLGKPVGQECLFRAFLKLTNGVSSISYKEAVERLNKLPWEITDENIASYWENVLWTGRAEGGRILTTTKNRNLTTQLIVHLAGGKMSDEEREKFEEDYSSLFLDAERSKSKRKTKRKLPDSVV